MILIQHNEQIIKTEDAFITKLLPANTLRFRFSQSNTNPTSIENGGTWTKVEDSEFNDWDWTCTDTNWESKFYGVLDNYLDPDIKIVAVGDTSNVTNMKEMFQYCTALTTISLFNTSNVTNISSIFYECSSLITVPLFDTSNVTSMNDMFNGCTNVESGALALSRAAAKSNKNIQHDNTFTNCGKDTYTGNIELQQIPADWGGTANGWTS